ncbi:glycosyltransferase [Shinella sp. JR1-6]|uniref:glycosyltransferase n=1 Tax=Shinella sp. JR1-6 TaxID=2527671 RepID=UPI00102D5064|nr:glycosyltransferase [Shinella sp. JR1-6]TAA51739.1 glycosyltransferase [Shinella sp. JR1-6]
MRILFVHNNFPGQYARIVRHLKGRRDVDMLSASLASNKQPAPIKRIEYTPHREARRDIHPALSYTETSVIRGQAAYTALLPVKAKGWKPDIILTHSGFGDGLFLKDLWPQAKYMPYFEWYYHAYGSDSSFLDHEAPKKPDVELKIRMKNTAILHDLAAMDWGQCPTEYQKSQFPPQFHERISVLHDGVDVDYFSPDKVATFSVGDLVFRKGDPVITYIARGMEPYRGFPQFMEAAAILQKSRPEAHIVIIGEDRVAYGAKRPDGKTYKEWALENLSLDESRIHFLGRQPLRTLRDALRVSAAHVYLTVPFVLSWSMMEAMSAGALIVGSDTDPVREIVTDGENGLLVPFFEPEALAGRLADVLTDQAQYAPLRERARTLMLERYDMKDLTRKYFNLIERVAKGQMGAP